MVITASEKENKSLLNTFKTAMQEKESLPRLLLSMAAIFAIIMIFTHNVARLAMTVGNSMNDTLQNGELLVVDEVTKPSAYERFDIIVFKAPNAKVSYVIKRIIGLPGDTVQVIDGKVFVNGEELKNDTGNAAIEDPGLAEKPVTLGEGEFFVMGDNRNNSTDSRSTVVGNAREDLIIGKVFMRVFPFRMF